MPKRELVERVIWQSKVFPDLKMTDLMLTHLRTDKRTQIVTRWDSMMSDLEAYLIRRPEKRPAKDWKKFVFNCARRRAQDVKEGKRFPDGRINLKAFEGKRTEDRPRRAEPGLVKQLQVEEQAALRAKLNALQRGSKEYNEILAKLKETNTAGPMSFGDIMKRIAEGAKQ